MKRIILTLLMLLNFSTYTWAQEETPNNNMGVGIQLGQYQKDFGLGVHFTTPYFAGGSIAFRLRANVMWYEHLDTNSEFTWTPYSNLSLGLIGVGRQFGDFIRLYGEGGLLLVLPSDKFSAQSSELGGYGLFGFEFSLDNNSRYFIEIGGVGSGAKADKLPGNPIYSNGLAINVGYRYQF